MKWLRISLFTYLSGLTETNAKYATIGIGTVMVIMTLISIPLMDKSGRRTLHLYGLGGMFIFSIFITISFLVKELVAWIWWLSGTLNLRRNSNVVIQPFHF